MKDRNAGSPGRVKVIYDDGATKYVTVERADEPLEEGTPLNAANLFPSSVSTRFGLADGTPGKGFEYLNRTWAITVPASGWSSAATNGWYTNQVAVDGMKAVYEPIWSLNDTNSATIEDAQDAFSLIKYMETLDGYAKFYALEAPETDVPVGIRGV